MIVGRGVSHIPAGVIGYYCDVIAHFVLVGITKKRIERLTHRNVWRPTVSGVNAIRIEELRIRIVHGISAVEPDNIDPSIRSDCKSAEPMPLVRIHRIVVDPDGRAKALPSVSASNKHHVRAVIRSSRLDTSQHINVIVRARPGPIDRQEYLPGQSGRIDYVARTDTAPQIDSGALIEDRDHGAVPRGGRPNTPNLACIEIHSAQEQIAGGVDIERSPRGRMRNVYWVEPTNAAIGRSRELSAAIIISACTPRLILKAVPGAIRVVDREPFFVASVSRRDVRPSLAAVNRTPHVIEERLQQAEIKKLAGAIRTEYRIAAEHIVFQNAGKRPGRSSVSGVARAALSEVRVHVIKLTPPNRHLHSVRRIDTDRRLVSGVADNVLSAGIHIDLIADEISELRNHPGRSLYRPQ